MRILLCLALAASASAAADVRQPICSPRPRRAMCRASNTCCKHGANIESTDKNGRTAADACRAARPRRRGPRIACRRRQTRCARPFRPQCIRHGAFRPRRPRRSRGRARRRCPSLRASASRRSRGGRPRVWSAPASNSASRSCSTSACSIPMRACCASCRHSSKPRAKGWRSWSAWTRIIFEPLRPQAADGADGILLLEIQPGSACAGGTGDTLTFEIDLQVLRAQDRQLLLHKSLGGGFKGMRGTGGCECEPISAGLRIVDEGAGRADLLGRGGSADEIGAVEFYLCQCGSPSTASIPGVGMVQKMIASLKAKTGRSLEEWIAVVKKSGPKSEKERREWLKEAHGLPHPISRVDRRTRGGRRRRPR